MRLLLYKSLVCKALRFQLLTGLKLQVRCFCMLFIDDCGGLQVWEVRAADLSKSPVHKAAVGKVDPERGVRYIFRDIRVTSAGSPVTPLDTAGTPLHTAGSPVTGTRKAVCL